MEDKEIRKTIERIISEMAKKGDKEMVFAHEHTQLDNKQWAIFNYYTDMLKKGTLTKEITNRYVEFYTQINKLYDEFIKAERIKY